MLLIYRRFVQVTEAVDTKNSGVRGGKQEKEDGGEGKARYSRPTQPVIVNDVYAKADNNNKNNSLHSHLKSRHNGYHGTNEKQASKQTGSGKTKAGRGRTLALRQRNIPQGLATTAPNNTESPPNRALPALNPQSNRRRSHTQHPRPSLETPKTSSRTHRLRVGPDSLAPAKGSPERSSF